MAEVKVPIQVNLPDNWIELIVDRLRNDPEAEWAEIIRCKDCVHHHYEKSGIPYCDRIDYGYGWKDDDFCSHAERREEGDK